MPGPMWASSTTRLFGNGELRAEGDIAAATRFVKATWVFTLAESLGGVESLIELPAVMTHASVPPDVRAAIGLPDGLIRLSVGVESIDDLQADLDRAFHAARG